jgi:hypothetical protein
MRGQSTKLVTQAGFSDLAEQQRRARRHGTAPQPPITERHHGGLPFGQVCGFTGMVSNSAIIRKGRGVYRARPCELEQRPERSDSILRDLRDLREG